MLRRSLVMALVCAPAVARGDEWSLHLVAGATASWSDNIFSSPEDPITMMTPGGETITTPPVEEDFYYQVSPGALFSYETPRTVHELSYGFEANFYQEHSDARSYLHRAGWRGFFLTSPRSELSAGAQYSTGQNNALIARDASGTPIGQPGGTTDFVSADVSENYHYSITRPLRLSQSFLGRRFETKDDFNTRSTGMELGGSVGLDRSWRDDAVGLLVSPTVVLLEQRVPPQDDPPTDAVVSGTDSLNVQTTVSWRRDLSQDWSSLLDAGATMIVPIDAGDQFVVQPTVGAQISYFPEWGSATAQVRRSVVPNLFIAQNTITDSATASLTLPLPWLADDPAQPRLSVRGTGGYQRTQIIELDTGDSGDGFDVIVGDLAVEYALGHGLALSARYQYIRQDAENDMLIETVDYTRQTAMITVYGRWPDRLAGEIPAGESLRVNRGNGVETVEESGSDGSTTTGTVRER